MRFLVLALVAACSAPIAGTPTQRPHRPPPPGPPIATALASDPTGIRVLANHNAGSGRAGLLATNATEYAALWHDVGLRSSPPAVNFTTHVVLGSNFPDGVCQPELVAANIDAAGILTFQEAHFAVACILLLSRTTRVVAVPRSLLPPHFTWRTDEGDFAFDLATHSSIATSPSITIDTGARTSLATSRGTVVLPAVGRIALRSLDDGRQIWVARRDTDDISAILADHPSRTPGIHSAVMWNSPAHRFLSDHDSRGRSVHGNPPLDVLAFARVDDDHISIGDPIAVAYAPPVPRDREPTLDGAAKPYTEAPAYFSRIHENHWGVIADSLVIGTSGPAQLCTLPEGKARQYLGGCLRSHPTVPAIPTRRNSTRGISMTQGPLAILRAGNTAAIVINLGNGESGWVVEHSFQRPAPRGPTARRADLPVGITVTGTTANGNNGFDVPDSCVPIVGRGSPDESWMFTAPRSGTYIFELETKYDGTLALLDMRPSANEGDVLACNDDAKGFYRRSLIRIELTAMTKVRVLVDGFGGDRGDYKLTVHEQPTLPRLEVGTPMTGDTTHAIDQESHGCSAPAGDHRYPLTIREAGRYAFRIDTPGWAPMLSVFPAGGSEFGCYTHLPPLIDSQVMEPGEYFVVIDGNDTKQRGKYTLSVSRCEGTDEKACEATARSR